MSATKRILDQLRAQEEAAHAAVLAALLSPYTADTDDVA